MAEANDTVELNYDFRVTKFVPQPTTNELTPLVEKLTATLKNADDQAEFDFPSEKDAKTFLSRLQRAAVAPISVRRRGAWVSEDGKTFTVAVGIAERKPRDEKK